MNKITSIILTLSMILTLSACSDNGNGSDINSSDVSSFQDEEGSNSSVENEENSKTQTSIENNSDNIHSGFILYDKSLKENPIFQNSELQKVFSVTEGFTVDDMRELFGKEDDDYSNLSSEPFYMYNIKSDIPVQLRFIFFGNDTLWGVKYIIDSTKETGYIFKTHTINMDAKWKNHADEIKEKPALQHPDLQKLLNDLTENTTIDDIKKIFGEPDECKEYTTEKKYTFYINGNPKRYLSIYYYEQGYGVIAPRITYCDYTSKPEIHTLCRIVN